MFAGVFELTDPSGRPAGHIEVMLKWKSSYVPPLGSIRAPEEPTFSLKESGPEQELHRVEDEETDEALQEEEEASRDLSHLSSSLTEDALSQVITQTQHVTLTARPDAAAFVQVGR